MTSIRGFCFQFGFPTKFSGVMICLCNCLLKVNGIETLPQRIIISITRCRSVYLWHLIETFAVVIFLVHKIKLGDCNVCPFVCADVNECTEKTKCQCPQCLCKNTWGSYDCTCSSGLLYIHEHDTCISESCAASSSPPPDSCFQATLVIWVIHSTWRLCPYPSSYMVCAAGKKISSSKLGWFVSLIVLVGMVSLGVIGYIIYKYRLRVQFFYSAISPAYFFPCILYSSGFVFWICLKCTELWCCCFHCCWVGNGSHTWIPRSGQSWHNTCHWIARMRFTTTCRRMLKLQVSDPSTPAQKGFYYACDENPVGGVSHLGLGHRKKHLVLFAISVCPWFQKSSQTTLVFCLGLMV